MTNPLVSQLTHRAFPDVAQALRAATNAIATEWEQVVRVALPAVEGMTLTELKDSVPEILPAMADALASADPDEIRGVLEHSPKQGLSRFRHKLDVSQVMLEDRLLRGLIVRHTESGLGRQMDVSEAAALHAVVDVMLHRSVVALVGEQMAQLRAAAEAELKFLSFLSHDLNNNLGSVMLMLRGLAGDLAAAGGFQEAEESLQDAQQSIEDTIAGMRRLLDHERLRKSGRPSPPSPVDLYAVAKRIVEQLAREAEAKGVAMSVDIQPGTFVVSNPDLLSVVLQNLVGNGVKYSSGGTVRVGSQRDKGQWAVWVSDQGPGIAPERIQDIFDAFHRGEVHGQKGVGLGLAIVSQAVKLLGAELTVDSDLGEGSTFRLMMRDDPSSALPTGNRGSRLAGVYAD